MAVALIFNHVYWFSQKNTLGKLVTMATRKRLFLIYKIENFANTQFWKVTKFQGASLFRCGVLSHLLGMGWKTPPPSAYRVKAQSVQLLWEKGYVKWKSHELKYFSFSWLHRRLYIWFDKDHLKETFGYYISSNCSTSLECHTFYSQGLLNL